MLSFKFSASLTFVILSSPWPSAELLDELVYFGGQGSLTNEIEIDNTGAGNEIEKDLSPLSAQSRPWLRSMHVLVLRMFLRYGFALESSS